MPEKLNLSTVAAARAGLADAEQSLTELRAQWTALSDTRERQLTGASAKPDLERTEQELADLLVQRTSTLQTIRERRDAITAESMGLLSGPFAEHAVTSMDGRTPFLLLPVRIETRFRQNRKSMLVRIFPDEVHINSHLSGLTDSEVELGVWYWEQRWQSPDDEDLPESAWLAVVDRRGARRARFVIDQLRPPETPGDAGGPTFPEVQRRPPGPGKPPIAVALPERWAAVGFSLSPGQAPREICRVWSDHVPDDLVVAPEMDFGASTDEAGDDGLEWMRDVEEARSLGMLVEITSADMAAGNKLSDGFDQLVVVGADWTRRPGESADLLDDLFTSHYEAGQFGYLTQGTPTNQTSATADGVTLDSKDSLRPRSGPLPTSPLEGSAAARFSATTGLRASALARAPGAEAQEHRWTSALVDATWEATAGFFLGEMMDPVVDDDHIERLREHAARHLHPGGPLPLVRIDRQPYGVLPVMAAGRAKFDDSVLATVHQVLTALRRMAKPAVSSVLTLDDASDRAELDDILVELLQRTPVTWSMKLRTLHDPVARHLMLQDWKDRGRLQRQVRNLIMRELGVDTTPRLDELVLDPRARPLVFPFVQKGETGTDYLDELAEAVRTTEGHQKLRLRQSSATLLEALLAFAGAQEIERAATDRLRLHVSKQAASPELKQALAQLSKRGVRTPALLGVDQKPETVASPLVAPFKSGRDLVNRRIDGIDATQSIGQVVSSQLLEIASAGELKKVIAKPSDPLRQLARFTQSLDDLTEAPADDLEWAFRGVLDCFSTRIDAWVTSLASARLAAHREASPDGVHIGCFGWVENLRPDESGAAESLGFLHSPSVAHASAVAILRAGRQASSDQAFDLAVTSKRVREAMRLLDGMSADQSLAALLGYRVERALRDSLSLARYILPLRELATLGTAEATDSGASQRVAGEVVDGLELLEQWRADPNAVLKAAAVVQRDKSGVRKVLDEIDATFDAVSDVLLAESIYQLSSGNLDRAGAAMRSHDRPDRPGSLDFVRSPGHGSAVAHRVIIGTTSTDADGWPRDLRSRAEPRLESWLAHVLGPADGFIISAELRRGDTLTDLGEISLDQLGLGALSVVLALQRSGTAGSNELAQRLLHHFAGQVTQPDPQDEVILSGLEPLEILGRWSAEILRAAPLRPAALLPDDVRGKAQFDVAELLRRATTVDRQHDSATQRVVGVVERLDDDSSARPSLISISGALDACSVFEPATALADVAPSHPDVRQILTSQLRETAMVMTARRVQVDDVFEEFEVTPEEEVDLRVDLLSKAFRIMLGSAQPVLPVFELTDPGPLNGGLEQREELLDGDETAPVTWLHKMALVRPNLVPFAGLLSYAESNGMDLVNEMAVTQWPLQRNPRWYALPNGPDGAPSGGSTAITAHFVEAKFDGKLAGLVIDDWSETIPDADSITGLSFHYDAPGARAPQSLLLAVHPDAEPDSWDFDLLVETVMEAIDLTRLRSVGPRELGPFAGLLPALFLPDDPSRSGASMPFQSLNETFRKAMSGQSAVGDVLGKD